MSEQEPGAVRCTCGLAGACDGVGLPAYPCTRGWPEAVRIAREWMNGMAGPEFDAGIEDGNIREGTVMARFILDHHAQREAARPPSYLDEMLAALEAKPEAVEAAPELSQDFVDALFADEDGNDYDPTLEPRAKAAEGMEDVARAEVLATAKVLFQCALTWNPEARIVGNVTAAGLARVAASLVDFAAKLAAAHETIAELTTQRAANLRIAEAAMGAKDETIAELRREVEHWRSGRNADDYLVSLRTRLARLLWKVKAERDQARNLVSGYRDTYERVSAERDEAVAENTKVAALREALGEALDMRRLDDYEHAEQAPRIAALRQLATKGTP